MPFNNFSFELENGGIGLSPGTKGFKSFGQYLKDRKLINNNTVTIFGDSSEIEPYQYIRLGLPTNEA